MGQLFQQAAQRRQRLRHTQAQQAQIGFVQDESRDGENELRAQYRPQIRQQVDKQHPRPGASGS